MTTKIPPTILIIIGITGDLAKRKLLPAIEKIDKAELLSDQFRLVGITRQKNTKIADLLSGAPRPSYLDDRAEILTLDVTDIDDYYTLNHKLEQIEAEFQTEAQRLFYLSVPPTVAQPIIERLGMSGLAKHPRTKLLLEKPFGVDLASAQELVEDIDRYFTPEQVYRIDHYLAKETAQNIVVFREQNSLFKRTWNRDHIERIDILASEEIDIQGRSAFYEQTGALRDLVQSHLLQLAALMLMESPAADKLHDVPKHRLRALQSLQTPPDKPIEKVVQRGQYIGYADAVKNPGSMVETFVSLQLESTDPRWQGVPITLTTGKALKEKFTQIRIQYKREAGYEANELVIHLQPNEGIEMFMWVKRPGYHHMVSPHALTFSFKDYYPLLPEAYEQVLFSGLDSDHTLFTSSQEVLETWRILDPIQKYWSTHTDDLIRYERGSDIREVGKQLQPSDKTTS